jgi:hypothetical protein
LDKQNKWFGQLKSAVSLMWLDINQNWRADFSLQDRIRLKVIKKHGEPKAF